MQRRTFLKWTAAGTAAAGAPAWLANREGDPGVELVWTAGEAGNVLEAFTHGTRTGRPVLVLLASEGDWRWGSIWGQTLNHGGSEVMADLCMCAVVCASREQVEAALPRYPGLPRPGEKAPLGVLLETSLARSVRIDATLADLPASSYSESAGREQAIRERMATVADALRLALLPDAASISERAEFALVATGSDRPADPLSDPSLAERLPALVRQAGEQNPELRQEALHRLAGVAASQLRTTPPRGAYWATYNGCGYEVEGLPEATPGIACGMGHVTELGRRFLYHATRS